MTMETWDIDRFPLEKTAISDAGLPETDAEWHTWEEAQRALGKPGASEAEGHSEYDPSVWMMGKHAPSHEKYHRPEESSSSDNGYHMPGITHPLDDDDQGYDDDEDREPQDYHVVTGPIGSNDRSEWTEHPYVMFEHRDSDYDPDAAQEWFEEDNHEYNPERNPDATHEVKHVHPAENHDEWHNSLRSEDEDFARIAPHGFQRGDTPGHRVYTYTDPHGGTHRLWHNQTTFVNQGSNNTTHGPGWRTSYWNPELEQHQQMPWNFHDDNTHTGDSLGDALTRVEKNKNHADIMHSGAGLKPVENLYGVQYTSRRPEGSVQQLMRDFGTRDNPDWHVVHYSPDTTNMHETAHGSDLTGALEQARRNLARG